MRAPRDPAVMPCSAFRSTIDHAPGSKQTRLVLDGHFDITFEHQRDLFLRVRMKWEARARVEGVLVHRRINAVETA